MVLAIDIGGSKFNVGILTTDGQLTNTTTREYDAKCGFSSLLRLLKIEVQQLLQVAPENLTGIGVALPGLTDIENGVLLLAPYSGWRNIPIQKIMENEFKLPVSVENDVKACAIGEKRFGACVHKNNYLWITLSNGIGGAIFIDGRLYRGSSGFSGEIGHIIVQPNGPQCGCGNFGCLESVASAAAIARIMLKQFESNSALAQLFPAKSTREIVKETFRLAGDGNVICQQVIRQAGEYIGIALASALSLMNPEVVIFGGGMALSLELLMPSILSILQKRVMPEIFNHTQIYPSQLGYYAALIGAGCLALGESNCDVKN
ncbi:ROK family protein [candidate division KSB1 bacterium]|nr:ROK family protein [candidate division KSB1 bacterium]